MGPDTASSRAALSRSEPGPGVAEVGSERGATARWLEADQPALTRGDPDGPTSVVRVRDGHHAGGHRRRRAAARTARGVIGVPGIARGPVGDRLGGDHRTELGTVRLPQRHQPGRAEAGRQVRVVGLRPTSLLEKTHPEVIGIAGTVAGEVLEQEGNPAKGSLRKQGRGGLRARLFEQGGDHGVERRVELLHASNRRVYQLHGRRFPAAHQLCLGARIQSGEFSGHVQILDRPATRGDDFLTPRGPLPKLAPSGSEAKGRFQALAGPRTPGFPARDGFRARRAKCPYRETVS